MTAPEPAFDKSRAKAFTQLVVRHFEGAAVTVMVEVGRRVGLFDAMARMGPATSAGIAAETGLHERYVREWLGAMVCGGVVEYDAAARAYRFPPEHAAALTGASTKNLATVAEIFPLLSRVIPDVVEAFRTGRGVPYRAYQPDFTGLMDRRSRPRYDEHLFGTYLALPEGLIPRLETGIRVADVGCGTGYCVALMARRFPRSTFVGYDLSEDAIAAARQVTPPLANASFAVQDIARLETPTPFDLVTAFDAIHDQADPAGVLRCIRAALAPGGTSRTARGSLRLAGEHARAGVGLDPMDGLPRPGLRYADQDRPGGRAHLVLVLRAGRPAGHARVPPVRGEGGTGPARARVRPT